MTTSHRSWGVKGIAVRRHAPQRPGPGQGLLSVRRPAVWFALALMAAVAVCTVMLPLKALGGSGAKSGTVFAHLAWGGGDGEVGLIEVDEGLTRGPEALAVSPDGRVAVLDSVNSRLVLLDPAGQLLGTVTLDLSQPRFLAADDQTLYVLDSDVDKTLATYSWSGGMVGETSAPDTDELVTGLFATSEGPCVEYAHDRCLLMAERAQHTLPGRPLDRRVDMVANASYKPSEGVRLWARSLAAAGVGAANGAVQGAATGPSAGAGNGVGAAAKTKAAQGPEEGTAQDPTEPEIAEEIELAPDLASGGAVEHLVSLDGDGNGGLLVGARLLRPQTRGGVTSCLAITRLASNNPDDSALGPRSINEESEAVLLLDESDFAYLGAPYAVSPDGRIFQPVADESGYTILVHSFEEVRP